MKLNIQLFADGKVVIETEIDNSGIKRGLKETENSVNKAGSTVKSIIAGLGITKLISTAMNTINQSIDGAIKRFDTLNNFPKVMSNLGISSSASAKAIDKLSNKLAGLPTTLDEGALAVQRFTSKNGDVAKSTDLFLALNNAILAGGASSEIQSSALEQLSQAYAKGKPDMMEWRTAMTAMPAQLKQVAQAMGYIDASALGEDLREGNISMDEFMNTIVQLNTQGVNGFKSFEEQARNSTGGIATSIKVAKTQVVKGITDIISSINDGLQKANLPSISDIIAKIGKSAGDILKLIGKNLPPIIVGLKNVLKILIKLTPAIVAVGTALLAWKIGTIVQSSVQGLQMMLVKFSLLKLEIASAGGVIGVAKIAMDGLNAAITANPIAFIVTAIVLLISTFVLLIVKCEAFRNFWIDLWDLVKKMFVKAWDEIGVFFTETIPKWIDNVIDFFKNLPYEIGYALGFVLGHIYNLGKDMKNWVTKDLPQIINAIIQFFKELPGKVWTWLKQVPQKVREMGTNMISTIKTKLTEFINAFVNKMKELPGKMKEIGKLIVEGLWEGIKNATGWIKKKVGEFAQGILDGMKDALSIHSPSRLFRDEVGKYIALGVGEGFIDEMDEVSRQMQKAIDLETARMSANVQSNGTYQMAMAGTPTFNLRDNSTNTTQLVVNGRTLAEVVNTENRNREVAVA